MKIISILILAMLISCTKKTEETTTETNGDSPVTITSQEITLTETDFSGELPDGIANTESINFNITGIEGEAERQRLYIKNQTGANIDLIDFNTLNPNTYNILRNRCPRVLSNRRICYLDFEVIYTAGTQDSVEQLFFLDGKNTPEVNPRIDITIQINEQYVQAVNESGEAIVKSQDIINFGTLIEGESTTRRLYLVNTSERLDLPVPTIPSTLPDGVSVLQTNCSGEIRKRASCFIDFKYDYQGVVGSNNLDEPEITLTSDNMSAANSVLKFQANNLSAVDPAAPKLAFSSTNFPAETKASDSYVRRIYVTNAGNGNYIFTDNNFVSGATVLRNTCNIGKELKPGAYCYADIQVDIANDDDTATVTFNIPDANATREYTVGEAAPVIPTYDSGLEYGQVQFQ